MTIKTPKRSNPSNPGDAFEAGKPGAQHADGDSTALYEFTAEERHARIAEVAYGLAERRGFAPGSETSDWLAAEREVCKHKPSNDLV